MQVLPTANDIAPKQMHVYVKKRGKTDASDRVAIGLSFSPDWLEEVARVSLDQTKGMIISTRELGVRRSVSQGIRI